MLVCDIETNGLLDRTSKVHCLSVYDVDKGSVETFSDRGQYARLTDGLSRLSDADVTVWHNGLTFDIPALCKVYPDFNLRGKVLDTLLLSRLFWPDLANNDFTNLKSAKTPSDPYFTFPKRLIGSHSLQAWGHRLGVLKGDFSETTDWQEWSEEMCEYNRQDVRVTYALYKAMQSWSLKHRSKKGWKESIQLEHDFQKIIFEQEQSGFPFNKEQAALYYAQLSAERQALSEKLRESFPPVDKGDWFTPKVNNAKKGYVKGQTIWRPKLVTFNPGSRQEIAERLKDKYDWTPTERTETGVAKIDETILDSLPYPEAKDLSRYFLLQKRLGQLAEGSNAWLKLVQPDGRIHGHVITNGAVTGRCTHVHPNMAQVPAVGVFMGEEFRSLFYAPDGWSVLGADASGLELRCLAHYLAKYDGGAYAHKILNGDIHWANAQSLGLVGKDEVKDPNNPHHMWARNKVAKRFIYALNYGAGDFKLGEVVDLTEEQAAQILAGTNIEKVGKITEKLARLNPYKTTVATRDIAQCLKGAELRATFMKNMPALKKLIDDVQTKAKTGWLMGIDGRVLPIRSQHSAFNTLLQSAGAIAVKKATCILWEDLRREGLDPFVQQVAHVHDEYQLLVKQGFEPQVGKIAVEAFRKAGEYFHFRIPLDGEFKVGHNWAETH